MSSLLNSGFSSFGSESQQSFETPDFSSEKIEMDLFYNKGRQTLQTIYPEVFSIMDELCNSMIKLTVEYEKKSLNNINKQFQDCIMNYFFEDFVGALIQDKFPYQTKTQIRQNFVKIISENKSAQKSKKGISAPKKYMLLPQLYIDEIKNQDKDEQYTDLLRDIAIEKIHFREGELRWRSQIRKKTFAVILLVHFFNGAPIQSIFEMWAHSFPKCQIKNPKPSKETLQASQKKIHVRHNRLSFTWIKESKPTKKHQFNHYSVNFLDQQEHKIKELDNDYEDQSFQNISHSLSFHSISSNNKQKTLAGSIISNNNHSSNQLSAPFSIPHFQVALPSEYQKLSQTKEEYVDQYQKIQIPFLMSQQHISDQNWKDEEDSNNYLNYPFNQPQIQNNKILNEQEIIKGDYFSLYSESCSESSSVYLEQSKDNNNNNNQQGFLNSFNQFASFNSSVYFSSRNSSIE